MAKRKSNAVAEVDIEQPRRSTRHKPGTSTEAAAPATAAVKTAQETRKPSTAKSKSRSVAPKGSTPEIAASEKPSSKPKASEPKPAAASAVDNGEPSGQTEKQYWLLKAEPETRLENGVDVKFSIDDLAAKTQPEPWDGIRNYAARNNLRGMKKGDLAFFYHSNCKEPGIVGTMEIVQEHSPDLSAHDPKAPYYDASSKPSDPKWSVVHVRFRSKFAAPITLKQLREMGGQGNPLESMQMLKLTRLSVSKVSAGEWAHLMGIAEEIPA